MASSGQPHGPVSAGCPWLRSDPTISRASQGVMVEPSLLTAGAEKLTGTQTEELNTDRKKAGFHRPVSPIFFLRPPKHTLGHLITNHEVRVHNTRWGGRTRTRRGSLSSGTAGRRGLCSVWPTPRPKAGVCCPSPSPACVPPHTRGLLKASPCPRNPAKPAGSHLTHSVPRKGSHRSGHVRTSHNEKSGTVSTFPCQDQCTGRQSAVGTPQGSCRA